MATDSILELTDGTTRLDLLYGPVRLTQDGWAPSVAPFRLSELGGLGEWGDTEERLPLQVVTTASQNPGAAYTSLQSLLAQAARWRRGEQAASPVRLRARPSGSRLTSGTALEAAVLGGEVGKLGSTFFRQLEGGATTEADAQLLRRGAWLDPTPSQVTGNQAPSQSVSTCTFATSTDTLSPTSIVLMPSPNVTSYDQTLAVGSRLLIGASASAFTIIDAEDLADGFNFETVASASARDGAYMRLRPAAAGVPATGYHPIASTLSGDVYIVASNPHSSDTVLDLMFAAAVAGANETLSVRLPALMPARVLYVGRLDGLAPFVFLQLRFTAAVADVTYGHVDTIVIHHDQGPQSASIEIGRRLDGTSYRFQSFSPQYGIGIRHAPLQSVAPMTYQAIDATGTPIANVNIWSPTAPMITYGDPAIQSRGASVAVLPLITNDSGQFVPQTTSGGGTAVQFVALARRYNAYLSLE